MSQYWYMSFNWSPSLHSGVFCAAHAFWQMCNEWHIFTITLSHRIIVWHKKSPVLYLFISPLQQNPSTTDLLPSFTFLRMSYKWNHIIYVAFRVWLHSLKMHRRFIPVAAGIKFANFHYWIVVHLWMYYSSFIQSLKRCGIVSSFPCYAPVLHYHRKPAGTWSKARNGSDLTDMAGPPQAHLSLSCERHAFWQLHRSLSS